MIVITQPHVVNRIRPIITRDASNNVATRDYNSPSPVALKAMFQVRAGALSQDEEGNTFSYDGVLYITDSSVDIKPDDLVIPQGILGISDSFRVTGREPKYDTEGKFTHYEIPLTRETTR